MLTALFEYFANVSQEAIRCAPPYRGRVELTHYGRYTLVMHETDGRIQRRWFLDEAPIFHYHLPQDVRRETVAEMYKAGCKAGEIAEVLGVNDSTISADLKHLRTYYANSVEPQVKPQDVTPLDLVLKSTATMKAESYQPRATDWLAG